MKRQILFGAAALFFLVGAAHANQPSYKPGVVLVRFASVDGQPPVKATKANIVNSVLKSSTAQVKKEYSLVQGLTLVELPAGVSVESAITSLKQSSSVLYAEPYYKRELCVVPNDTNFGDLWGMHNTGQTGGTIDADIDAVEAWDISTGSRNIVVAVTDTGVDYNHPDLAANMWHNPGEIPGNGIDDDGDGYIDDVYGCDAGDNDGDPMDDCNNPDVVGHGTHVSGTIGAVGNNARGVAGVCWNVSIMAVKIADANGDLVGDIDGIEYAVRNGANVINASWGGLLYYSQAEYDAIAAARDAGIIFVAAAGNYGINNDSIPFYPASYDLENIISVMATTDTDSQAGFSNYGLISVDIGAPGGDGWPYGPEDILSTVPGGNYEPMAGTSMASPHVAGAAALLLSIDPTLTYQDVKDILIATVDQTLLGLCVSGGRMNLFEAAKEAATDTTPPTPPEWEMVPTATGPSSISMEAKAGYDRSGVKYYFECTTNGQNSGWRANPLYSFTGLNANTTYSFRFKMRDNSTNRNETDWSTTLDETTGSAPDDLPPAPNPTRWAIKPGLQRVGSKYNIRMKAKAVDQSGVEFQFRWAIDAGSDTNSAWQDSDTFAITGLSLTGQTYKFRCRARDKLTPLLITDWSTQEIVVLRQGPRVLTVPIPYSTIRDAIYSAGPGDIVEISPGTYYEYNLSFEGRAITVRSVDPENPDIVAATIVNPQGNVFDQPWARRGFIFNSGEQSNSVLAGLTIINGRATGQSWPTQQAPMGYDGNDGWAGAGGGILIGRDPNNNPVPPAPIAVPSHPTIYKCIIRNCLAIGGNGQSGGDGNDGNNYEAGDPQADPPVPPTLSTPGQPGGKGGSTGAAFGGGIYVSPSSKPIIKDCQFISCYIVQGEVAGNGGNGGDGGTKGDDTQERGGDGGRGGGINWIRGGGLYVAEESQATVVGCTFEDCNAILDVTAPSGSGGTGGEGNPPGNEGLDGWYAGGQGGGAHYSMGTKPLNISTTSFKNNQASQSGGGLRQAFEVGAALLTLSECNFTGNVAGYIGGGFEGSHNATIFYNSFFADNNADGGGGVVIDQGSFTADSSTFADNLATEGGAISCFDSSLNLHDCNITGNIAEAPSGFGGGIALRNSSGFISNTLFKDNTADINNGGAVFTEGWNASPLELTNCLITDNSASEKGGGLFCKLGAWARLINCTVADNFVTNFTTGSGGGICCAEDSAWVEVINSIVWGNSAAYGPQIAVGARRGSDPYRPVAYVDVDYSDVEGGQWAVFIERDETQLWWYLSSFDKDPLFISPHIYEKAYYLRQIAAGQMEDSPCLDAGNDTAVNLGLDGFTTRTDQVGDEGIVDVGYHYKPAAEVQQYWLTIEVVDGNGTLTAHADGDDPFTIQAPDSRLVKAGTEVSLQVMADLGFEILSWTGTDDDASTDPNNTVTMNSDKVVRVTFYQFKLTIEVQTFQGYPPDGEVNATGDGDDPFTITARAVPVSRGVTPGTVVQLYATADENFRVMSWSGTDDDTSTEPNNTVTMNSDKTVIVAFEPDNLFYLSVTVIGNGTVTPSGRTLRRPGEVVTLIATPDNSSDEIIWTGTDYDYSISSRNTVTMNEHKLVTVEFYRPRILNVGASSTYPTIQAAIDDAHDRDIIQLMPSGQPYYTQAGFEIYGQNITITSIDPYDPAVVAATVIQQEVGEEATVGPAFFFYPDLSSYPFKLVGPLMRLQGITIRGFSGKGRDGINGDPARGFYDGVPGGTPTALGIECLYSSPTIINCVIDDCNALGGDGGDGAAGQGGETRHPNGGNGGWPGGAWGGAVYCLGFPGYPSNPTFINCTFSNNSAVGGNGGDGGAGAGEPDYGEGGKGGGWYYGYPVIWDTGDFDGVLPKDYSGLGGAVHIDFGCAPTFQDCNFIDNRSAGGLNGICGQNGWLPNLRFEPTMRYKIDTLGGAVYMRAGSSATFDNCTFTSNVAEPNKLPASNDGFVGFGGAVAAEDGATPVFKNCWFDNSLADVGGGIYASQSDIEIEDSSFTSNMAIHGAGMLLNGGQADVQRSLFIDNDANSDGSEGAAIAIFGAGANIIDSTVADNNSMGHAGGIYASSRPFGGDTNDLNNTIFVKNSLIVNNTAALGGAGITAVWHSDPNIVNCTITGNTSPGGRGGGLYSAYSNHTAILNSIVWGNSAATGKEIAVGVTAQPSSVDVYYSDVNQTSGALLVNPGCALHLNTGIINANPLFVGAGDYHLSNVLAGQSKTSPCVDAGSDLVSRFGLSTYTTRTDNVADTGIVDMGYHYLLPEGCLMFDYNGDGIVAFEDFAHLALSWLVLDEYDLSEFSDCWLFGQRSIVIDTTPPQPDPMQWLVPPAVASTSSISMVAVTATDESGPVLYEFEETTGNPGATDSGWQESPMYTDTGLQLGYQYCYRVRARDAYNNITGWSEEVCVSNLGDVTPPAPPPTVVIIPEVNNVTPDVNTSSGQFQWPYNYNWWHKVVVDISDITDDVSPTTAIEAKFICTTDGAFSSDSRIPAGLRPIYIGTPVAMRSGDDNTGWRLTYDGGTIVYDVSVDKYGGTGKTLNWKVCVYDESGNQACSAVHTIGPPSP